MRTRSLPSLAALALAVAAATGTLAACGGDDGAPAIDAPTSDGTPAIDGPTSDGTPAIDAPGACHLPTATIGCTAGNNAPCTAVCGNAYCYNFNQVGVVCTQPCTIATDCPQGWSCNMMGRCRPPG